jgi:hypothetical protein
MQLKDKHNNIIGYIDEQPDGTLVAKDHGFKILGYYDPKSNRTCDRTFYTIGYGNLLTTLFTKIQQ